MSGWIAFALIQLVAAIALGVASVNLAAGAANLSATARYLGELDGARRGRAARNHADFGQPEDVR